MDLTIYVGTSLSSGEITTSKDVTVRDLLVEQNVSFNDGQVTFNGRVLGTAEMNQTLEELEVEDEDYILAVSKHDNGGKPE